MRLLDAVCDTSQRRHNAAARPPTPPRAGVLMPCTECWGAFAWQVNAQPVKAGEDGEQQAQPPVGPLVKPPRARLSWQCARVRVRARPASIPRELLGSTHASGAASSPASRPASPARCAQVWLEDCSANGTWCNGAKLGRGKQVQLSADARIGLLKPAEEAAVAFAFTPPATKDAAPAQRAPPPAEANPPEESEFEQAAICAHRDPPRRRPPSRHQSACTGICVGKPTLVAI